MSEKRATSRAETLSWTLLLTLFNGLAVVGFVHVIVQDSGLLSLAVLVAYVALVNVLLVRLLRGQVQQHRATYGWLVAVAALWVALAVLVPSAAYLLFPLCILLVWCIPILPALLWSGVLAAVAIVMIATERGWSGAGVVGPILGWMVAVGGAWLYRRLREESADRERMYQELSETQQQLALSERNAGQQAERARIAQDLHDTTAQGLASIQMLLRSVEVADPNHPQIETIALANKTAGNELAEIRRVINDLAPTSLADGTLGKALERLAEEATSRGRVRVTAKSRVDEPNANLSLAAQIVLLRIGQGAVSNIERHSQATVGTIMYAVGDGEVSLQIADNGRGTPLEADGLPTYGFGVTTMHSRMLDLGGSLEVDSRPSEGTTITAKVPLGS